jgi:hypothetical protein
MTSLGDQIGDAAADALTATRPRRFDTAIDRFTLALQTVPDYPAAELSDEAFARVTSLAEQVISAIEHRLEDDVDDRRREALGARVYDIRRGLENAFAWRRHYRN